MAGSEVTEAGGPGMPVAEGGPRKTNVFISYSRRDGVFAERLRDRLIGSGFAAYLDKHDIAAGEDWRARLGGLIETADTMVFLISPDSIASDICGWEVDHAESLGKRILPVVLRATDDGAVPDRLRRLNYVFMRDDAEESSEFPKLGAALAVDIGWVRAHTRFGEQALEWDRAGRPTRLLVRGAGIGEAERWRDGRPATAPAITETQLAFVTASRAAATRRQRGWIAGSASVAAVAVALSIYAFFQQRAAEASRRETASVLATSDFRQGSLLVDAEETAADGIAFLSRAARSGDERARTRLWTLLQQRSFWVPSAESRVGAPVASGAAAVPEDVVQRFASVELGGETLEPHAISVSGDGRRVFTSAGDNTEGIPVQVRVWNRDGTPVTAWWEPAYDGDQYLWRTKGHFSGDGRYLAVEMQGWREPAILLLYDLQSMKQVEARIEATGLLPQEQNIGFNAVAFQEETAKDGERRAYMVTASARGDARVFLVDGDSAVELGANRHRSPVTLATFDAASHWLISAGTDRVVRVSDVLTDEPVGGLVRLDRRAVRLETEGPDAIAAVTEEGARRVFGLRRPARVVAAAGATPPVAEAFGAEGSAARQEPCLRTDDDEDTRRRIDHPSGLAIALSGGRQVSVARKGAAPIVSPAFAADVTLVCASADATLVSVTTSDFRTEIWKADFSGRIGQAIDERRFFGDGPTPEKTDWVQIAPDGRSALVRSSFWDAPNLDVFWISLWDIASGLPLIDRQRFADDGLSEGVVRSATIDPRGGNLVYLGDERMSPRAVQLRPPQSVPEWLSDYTEAAGGLAIGDDGVALSVRDRTARLDDGARRLEALSR